LKKNNNETTIKMLAVRKIANTNINAIVLFKVASQRALNRFENILDQYSLGAGNRLGRRLTYLL